MFIANHDDIKKKSRDIIAKIRAHNPDIFIISSLGSATKNCNKIKSAVMSEIADYSSEIYQNEDEDEYSDDPTKKIFFLKRKEMV